MCVQYSVHKTKCLELIDILEIKFSCFLVSCSRYSFGLIDCLANEIELECGKEASYWLHDMKMHLLSDTLNEIGCEMNGHLGAAAILGIVISLLVTLVFVCGISILFKRQSGLRSKQSFSSHHGSGKRSSLGSYHSYSQKQKKKDKNKNEQHAAENANKRLSNVTLITSPTSTHAVGECLTKLDDVDSKKPSMNNSVSDNNMVKATDTTKQFTESEFKDTEQTRNDNKDPELGNGVANCGNGSCNVALLTKEQTTLQQEEISKTSNSCPVDADDTSDEFTTMLNEAIV